MLYLTISLIIYFDQFRAPCFHSCNKPSNKIIIKIILVIDHHNKFEILKIKIIGKIKAISTSKIRKIIVIKKNRIEKGKREEFIGSKPHSKGDVFSRSFIVFFASNEARYITIIAMIKIIKDIRYKFIIIYTKKV